MAKVQKRDNAYWEGILKRKHPRIHADYLAGRFKSMADARRAAGLIKPRTRLHELRNAWKKASPAERLEFLSLERLSYSTPATPATASTPAFSPDGRLTSATKARIEDIMSRRAMSKKDLNLELGIVPLNTSVHMALIRGSKIAASTRASIEAWLKKSAGV